MARLRRLAGVGLVSLLLAPLVVSTPSAASQGRFRHAAAPYALDIARWEVAHLVVHAPRLAQGVVGPTQETLSADQEMAKTYFAAGQADSDRVRFRPELEIALERALTNVLRRHQVAPLLPFQPASLIFPPVSLTINQPPKLLVVSPRDRIALTRSLMLVPSMEWAEAQKLEARVDNRSVVSLVVPIGGISTYPALVPDSEQPQPLLEAAVHEWVHAYLFFTPLGQRYWSDYQVRAVNETVADLVARELADHLARELGLAIRQPGAHSESRDSGFDFRAEMRKTRLEVERLLAMGEVEQAEAYMEQREKIFSAHGYPIRKLNQAYFAFHGSYAESGAAGESPIPAHLRQLRQQSSSVGEFLARVSRVRSAQELAEMVDIANS